MLAAAMVIAVAAAVFALFVVGILPGLYPPSGGGGGNRSASTYPVTFIASGLPNGTPWSVTFAGSENTSTGTTITYVSPNGSFPFTVGIPPGYSADPASGRVIVNGGPTGQGIAFRLPPPPTYTVTFGETGLPSGTSWSVRVNGTLESSSSPSSIVFDEPNGSYAFTVLNVSGYSVGPASGTLIVNGAALSVPVTFTVVVTPQYVVTFTETGEPPATGPGLYFNGPNFTAFSPAGSATFLEPNGTYRFLLVAGSGYVVQSSTPPSPLTVNGSAVSVSITYQAYYAVGFTATGLAPGAVWSVTFNGLNESTNGSSLLFPGALNGTYSYSVEALGYRAQPSNGTVTVNGASLDVAIAFTGLPPPPRYPVTFLATGVPNGSGWELGVWSTTGGGAAGVDESGARLSLDLPNGSYTFTARALELGYLAIQGSFNVSGGPVNVSVVVAKPVGYPLTFTETGLPAGTSWTVAVDTVPSTGSNGTIRFVLPNGTYEFSVSASNYTASPSSGNVSVAGAQVNVSLVFTSQPVTYSIAFASTGIAANALWSVTLLTNSTNATASAPGGQSIRFSGLSNGSYSFFARAANYSADPATGRLTVNGSALTQAIAFAPSSFLGYSVRFHETGLSGPSPWSVFWGGLSNAANGTGATSLGLLVSNGTYGWSVFAPGYEASPTSGVVVVNGTSTNLSVAFAPLPSGRYTVLLEPVASPTSPSARWNATLGGVTQQATGFVPVFWTEPNGSYAWSVATPSGFTVTAAAGTVEVDGALTAGSSPTSVGAIFSLSFAPPSSPTPAGGGAPPGATAPVVGWDLTAGAGVMGPSVQGLTLGWDRWIAGFRG